MQVFKPGANAVARLVMASLVVVPLAGVAAAYGVARSPYATGQDVTREQPVPFSHAHHVGGLGLDCRYCHASVETARHAGVPATDTCMTCHSQVWTAARLLAPVRESLASDKPIAWTRVADLPGYVYFDHSVHIAKGVGCSTCHGDVAAMPLMRQAAPMTMAWCLDCHRDPAKSLRPLDAVFDADWTPPADQESRGRALMDARHVRVGGLTDCSTCHR